MTESTLARRTALVTGGGRGIGAAVAEQLAAEGAAKIILVSRSVAELEATAERVRAVGPADVTTLPVDLSQPSGVDVVVAASIGSGATVDVLISAAAVVAPLGPTPSLRSHEVRASLDLNVTAPILLAGALLPRMIEQGFGRVVNVSSGVVAHPASMIGGNVYATSKAALEAHTLNLAAELAGTGATANVYRPGTVDTAMQGWIREQDPDRIGRGLHDRFVGMRDSGALITPQESAAALVARLVRDPDANGVVWDVADPVEAH